MQLRDPDSVALLALTMYPEPATPFVDLAEELEVEPLLLSLLDTLRELEVSTHLLERFWRLALRVPPARNPREAAHWARAWEITLEAFFDVTDDKPDTAQRLLSWLKNSTGEERVVEFLEGLVEVYAADMQKRAA